MRDFAENDDYFTKQEHFRDEVPHDSQRQGFVRYLDGSRECPDLNRTDLEENEDEFKENASSNLCDKFNDKSRFGRGNDGENGYQLKDE